MADAKGPWLALHGVTMDWSPLALLSRTVKADRFHADSIEIARVPESSGGPSGSGLPVSLAVAHVDLPEITLGDLLAGKIASVSAEGALQVERAPLSVKTDLSLARADGHAGTLDAHVAYLPDDNRLDVKLAGSEPKGGVIAGLLDLAGEPAVDIKVEGSGPLSNWKGDGTLALDGTIVTRVSALRQATEQGDHVEAQGEGAFQAFLPAGLRPLAAGSTTFDFAGTLSGDRGLSVDKFDLASDALSASAAGQVDPAGASDFTFSAKAKGAPVGFGFGGVSLALEDATLRAFGAGRTPGIDASASLAAVRAGNVSASGVTAKLHSDTFDVLARTGDFRVSLDAASAGSVNTTVAGLLAGRLQAVLSGTIGADSLTLADATLKSDAATLEAKGSYQRDSGAADASFDARLLSGVLPAAARGALAKTFAASGKVSRGADGSVQLSGLRFASGGLTAQGNATLAGASVKAEISGALADVGVLAPDARGKAAFSVSASGALAAPDLSLNVSSDRLESAGRAITGLRLSATGKADLDNPAATVTLAANVGGEKLTGGAKLTSSGGKREVKDLVLSLGANHVEGGLVLDENFLPAGNVDFVLADLEPLAALVLDKATGSAKGTLRFSNGAHPAVAVDAVVDGFAQGDISGSGIAVKATVADYATAPVISGHGQGEQDCFRRDAGQQCRARPHPRWRVDGLFRRRHRQRHSGQRRRPGQARRRHHHDRTAKGLGQGRRDRSLADEAVHHRHCRRAGAARQVRTGGGRRRCRDIRHGRSDARPRRAARLAAGFGGQRPGARSWRLRHAFGHRPRHRPGRLARSLLRCRPEGRADGADGCGRLRQAGYLDQRQLRWRQPQIPGQGE